MATKKTDTEIKKTDTKKTTTTKAAVKKATTTKNTTTTKKTPVKKTTTKQTAKKTNTKATTKPSTKKTTKSTTKKTEPKKTVTKKATKKPTTKKAVTNKTDAKTKTNAKKTTTKKNAASKKKTKKQNGIFFIGNKKTAKSKTVKNNKLKLIPYIIIFIILGAIIAFSLFNVITWLLDNKKANDLTDDLNGKYEEQLNMNKGDLVNAPNDPNSDYWYYINMPFYNINFDNLLKINKDTVAFIHIDNTQVNYPVVQTSDNSFYLNHAFNRKKNGGGWLFMDYRNDINNLSSNTVIYGHGRKNKTMFGTLSNVLTKEWQNNKDNYVIYLDTKNTSYVFQIFSIYSIKSEIYYIQTDFNTTSAKKEWLKIMKKRNIAPFTTTVNENDKILTLSTCKNNNGDRIVVQAKLIKKQSK